MTKPMSESRNGSRVWRTFLMLIPVNDWMWRLIAGAQKTTVRCASKESRVWWDIGRAG